MKPSFGPLSKPNLNAGAVAENHRGHAPAYDAVGQEVVVDQVVQAEQAHNSDAISGRDDAVYRSGQREHDVRHVLTGGRFNRLKTASTDGPRSRRSAVGKAGLLLPPC